METRMDRTMIAPCGMNCGICMAHLRDKNRCMGCRANNSDKSGYCRTCIIVNCAERGDFCGGCSSYPCKRLKSLDKRYRTKYRMSMLENLAYIKAHGVDAFVESEKVRWKCGNCGGVVCVHRDVCPWCGEKV